MGSTYQKQLTDELVLRGWEHVGIDPMTDHWWASEVWEFRSTSEAHGLSLWLTFEVHGLHPQSEPQRRGVNAVLATEKPPSSPPATDGIARLELRRGRFDTSIQEFLERIDKWRHAQPSAG